MTWLHLCSKSIEKNLANSYSNHCPILFFFLISKDDREAIRGRKPFCFENWWLRHKACKDVVKANWSSSHVFDAMDLVGRLRDCDRNLEWNKNKIGYLPTQIKAKEHELQNIGSRLGIVMIFGFRKMH